jgi:hypothetical protein
MDENKPLRPEWSHRVETGNVGSRPFKVTLNATPEERKDLARRLRLQELSTASAVITLEREAGSSLIRVEGVVEGQLIQTCVSTGQPVHDEVKESFETWYTDPSEAVPFAKARREKLIRGERELEVLPERDDPELATDGFIDVGELATQYLSLGINPYPHAGDMPPVGMDEVGTVATTGPAKRNPFAALKEWKRSKDEN